MDDNVSIKSSDSVTTSGEYEMVPEASVEMSTTQLLERQPADGSTSITDGVNADEYKAMVLSPQLNIANNGDISDLEKNMTEVIHELEVVTIDSEVHEMTQPPKEEQKAIESVAFSKNSAGPSGGVVMVKRQPPNTLGIKAKTLPTKINTPLSSTFMSPVSSDVNKVGQSVFYDCTDFSSTAEKQDDMKPERSDTDEEMSDIDQDCTVFAGVTYLGAATINAPKSETEIHRNMTELNAISDAVGLKISVSIPSCSEGHVVYGFK